MTMNKETTFGAYIIVVFTAFVLGLFIGSIPTDTNYKGIKIINESVDLNKLFTLDNINLYCTSIGYELGYVSTDYSTRSGSVHCFSKVELVTYNIDTSFNKYYIWAVNNNISTGGD